MPDLSGTPLSGRKKAYSVVDVGEEADELEGGSSRNQTRKGKKRRQDTSVDANEEEPQLSLKQLAGGGVVALLCLVVISKISYSMIKAKNAVISQEADTSLQESARLQHKLNHYDHQSQHSSFSSTQHSLSLPSTQLSSPPPPPPPRPSLQQAMEQQKAQGGESWQQPPQRSQQSQQQPQQPQQPQQELRPGAGTVSTASTGPSLTSPPPPPPRPSPSPPPPPSYLGGIFAALHITNEEEEEPYRPPSPPSPPPPPPPMPPIGEFLQQLNARFARDVRTHEPFEAGILIHQLDGFEDTTDGVSPCSPRSSGESCKIPRVRQRAQRVSASLIFAGLKTRDSVIPTPSSAGGVILRPEHVHALCGYGMEARIDESKPLACNSPKCVPGCGEPPEWCSKQNLHDEGSFTCGFARGRGGVRPWKPEDFGGQGGLFDLFEKQGDTFTAVGIPKGYNQLVVSADPWLQNLPHSIEAMFFVECEHEQEECLDARERMRATHEKFLVHHKISAAECPLLSLRPSNWDEPFAATTMH